VFKNKASDEVIATIQFEKKILDDKLRKLLEELAYKEDQLIVMKTEFQTCESKLKFRTEEANIIRIRRSIRFSIFGVFFLVHESRNRAP
jgi:hypothetical protein